MEHEFYLDAFRTLGSDRQSGLTAARIGWKSVVFYGQFHSLPKREIEELWYVIKAMDEVVLEGSTAPKTNK